jgi:dienelactone hydrolase
VVECGCIGADDGVFTMWKSTLRVAALGLALVAGGAVPAATTFETIEIPSGDLKLKAVLFRPAGAGPFPAVVALHACRGLGVPISERYRDWGQRLAAQGFAVLFPSSFGPRGYGQQCTVWNRAVAPQRARVGDADAARRWLQGQDWVVADRVSLVGWGHGAAAALFAIRPQAARRKEGVDFRTAVAIYPGCGRLADIAWSARVPTLILMGAKDDVNSPKRCAEMVAGARGRSAHTAFVVYPDALHDFDHPNLPLREFTGLIASVDGSGRAHSATNLMARADTLTRVPQWLAR